MQGIGSGRVTEPLVQSECIYAAKSALHYGDYRAGSIIEIMHQLELIEPVKGHGKGK